MFDFTRVRNEEWMAEMTENKATGWTVLFSYDEQKRMVRADFTNPHGEVEGRRWYPNYTEGEDVIWLDVANWTANNGIACSGRPGAVNEGDLRFQGSVR